MSRILSIFVAALALAAIHPRTTTATLIDDFSQGDQFLNAKHANVIVSTEDTASAIGGYRDLWLEKLSGGPSYSEVVTASDDDPGFYFTQGVGATAEATIVWGGQMSSAAPTINGQLNENLLLAGGQEQFVIDVAGITGDGMDLAMTVYSTDSSFVSTAVHTIRAGEANVVFSFSEFDGCTFQNVAAIKLVLDGSNHPDASIRITRIETMSGVAPEPSTLALAATGVVGLFVMLRRRRNS